MRFGGSGAVGAVDVESYLDSQLPKQRQKPIGEERRMAGLELVDEPSAHRGVLGQLGLSEPGGAADVRHEGPDVRHAPRRGPDAVSYTHLDVYKRQDVIGDEEPLDHDRTRRGRSSSARARPMSEFRGSTAATTSSSTPKARVTSRKVVNVEPLPASSLLNVAGVTLARSQTWTAVSPRSRRQVPRWRPISPRARVVRVAAGRFIRQG